MTGRLLAAVTLVRKGQHVGDKCRTEQVLVCTECISGVTVGNKDFIDLGYKTHLCCNPPPVQHSCAVTFDRPRTYWA